MTSKGTAPEQRMIDRFTDEIAEHCVTVEKDDGLYRHLECRNPKSHLYWFDIITSPGLLTINGDVGTFVFAHSFNGGKINPAEWAEHLVAIGRDGAKTYDSNAFRKRARYEADEGTFDWTAADRQMVLSAVEAMISEAESFGEDPIRALRCLEDFKRIQTASGSFEFVDVWEWDLSKYTDRFLWCCHAVNWAIIKYGELTAEAQKPIVEGHKKAMAKAIPERSHDDCSSRSLGSCIRCRENAVFNEARKLFLGEQA